MNRHEILNLKQFVSLGKADLHIHSNYSDGRPTIQEILDYVEEKTDLNVIAITDHDTAEGALLASQLIKKKRYRFELIVGEEVTSLEGHIIGLFLSKTIPPGMAAHQVLKEIHSQGGLAIAAHPFESTTIKNPDYLTMNGVGMLTLIREKNHFDGIETVNGTPTLRDENLQAAFLNRALLFKAETGSSDAHIVEAIGKGYTLFEGKTKNDLRESIEHLQTQSMYDRWGFRALVKYLFFFIPKGLRMLGYTIVHGRSPKDRS